MLSEKLALDAATQNQTVSELIESCRSDLKGFVKSECDAVAAKCDQVKRETGDYLKVRDQFHMTFAIWLKIFKALY